MSAPDISSGAGVRTPANALRGDYEAVIGGETIRFDTALATVAALEARCGEVPIVEAVNRAVFGRRAADQRALVAGALAAAGRPDAEALAARTSVMEAEAFILALMGALGFTVARVAPGTPEGAPTPPFPRPATAGASDGAAGAPSRSAP